jgi:hypothetical protein
MPMVYAVGTDFMSPLNDAFEEINVFPTPVGLFPIWMFDSVRVNRIGVSNQEKRSLEAVLVKDGDGSFELASQSIVESERNKCWGVH